MNKHIISCLALTLLAANGFCQQPTEAQIEKAIITAAQMQEQDHAMQHQLSRFYKHMYDAMATLQKTDTKQMIEAILPTAEMYNQLNQANPELAQKEAKRLNVEFRTAYTLRTTLLDLFEGPLTEHDNQTLKDFEKNLRINLLGGQEYVLKAMSVSNKIPTTLYKAYQTIINDLKNTAKPTDQLPAGLTDFMTQFEYLNTNNPALAQDVISTLLVYPQETGWGATTSLRNIFKHVLIEYWAGGDAVSFKTEQELVKQYGDETGKLLSQMSHHLYNK